MIIDDEPDIAHIMVKGLQLQGHKVMGFTEPLKALNEFKSNSAKYDLVISDIRMPEMDGLQLVTHMKRLKPEIKIILMTGFAVVDNISEYPIERLLTKPVSLSALRDIVGNYLLQ
jgi:DNA-binding NtrC family response regulator